MKNVMLGANRYIRGAGVLAQIGEETALLGQRGFCIGGNTALSRALPILRRSLEARGASLSVHPFTTEVCREQAEAYRDACLGEKADFVVGVGGGKALDVSKWCAQLCGLPVVTVPTCASTCACMVSLIVTYHANGQADKGIYAANSPWLCLADTEIIGQAPLRLMLSGVADTLSKWPETHYAMRDADRGVFNFLTSSLSREIFDTLLAKGPEVIRQAKEGDAGRAASSAEEDALGELVDVVFFMSALVGNTAGDAYRLAVAHSVHNGLIAVEPGVIHAFYHGEKVGYGTLVQLALLEPGESPWELREIYDQMKRWGLPVSLRDFGLRDNAATVAALVKATRGPKLQAGPSYVSTEALTAAILRIEQMK